MSEKDPNWSLRKEIEKRKTQQTPAQPSSQRPAPPPPPSRQTGNLPSTPPQPSRRTTTTTPPPAPRQTQSYTPSSEPERPRRRGAVAAGLGIGLIGGLVVLALVFIPAITAPPPATPTAAINLDTLNFKARDVIEYLQFAQVPLFELRAVDVPNSDWLADEGYSFIVRRGDQTATYFVFSYDPPGRITGEKLRLPSHPRYGEWKAFSLANVMAVSNPESSQTIVDEINSHLTSMLASPYINGFPTTTGTPLAIAYQQTQQSRPTATDTPLPSFTPVVVEVTFVRESPTPTPTFTSTREVTPTLSRTPFPTRTPFGFGGFLQTQTADAATKQAINPPTLVPTTQVPPTLPPNASTLPVVTPPPQPTFSGTLEVRLNETPVIVAALPTVEPQESNSEEFNVRVPEQVGEIKLIKSSQTINKYGSTMIYTLPDGTQLFVVLWITTSPREAFDRYQLDLNNITSYQRVPVGEAGLITAPLNYVYAMTIRANTVIIIYRPNEYATLPTNPIRDDLVIDLLQQLYNAIPAQS